MSDPTQTPPDDDPADPPPASPFPESSLVPGDPLDSAAAPQAPGQPPPAVPAAYPPGYSSPPPPGAGGLPPAHTPPAPGTYTLGSWGARVGAAVIDGLIIGIPAVIVMLGLAGGVASTDGGAGTAATIGALLLSLLIFLVIALFYAPVMMSRTNGQTVGRMATGIRVIRANGAPMTFGFAALREIVVKGLLVGTIGSFTAGLASLIDVLWPLWDDENRALHDMVVDTRTVKA